MYIGANTTIVSFEERKSYLSIAKSALKRQATEDTAQIWSSQSGVWTRFKGYGDGTGWYGVVLVGRILTGVFFELGQLWYRFKE